MPRFEPVVIWFPGRSPSGTYALHDVETDQFAVMSERLLVPCARLLEDDAESGEFRLKFDWRGAAFYDLNAPGWRYGPWRPY